MKEFCDLHVHSRFSDGTLSPRELIQLAEKLELSAIALTDHNTVDGLPDFMAAGSGSPVQTIPGIEFSTDYRGIELHIIGLYIRPCYYEQISRMMAHQVLLKEQSNMDLIAALKQDGYEVDYDKLKASTPNGFVNRAMIASALTEKGYTQSIQDAFQRLLSPKGKYYVPPKRPDVYETIKLVKSMGAAAVLAHPFLNLDREALEDFLPRAVEAGLDGMEVYYPRYDAETTALACQIADAYGLLPSGGSDFHGDNKPDIQMGVGRGNLAIPAQWYRQLKALCPDAAQG